MKHSISRIREALAAEGLAGWLLHDFRGSNHVAMSLLCPGEAPHLTRRFLYWIPASGEPLRFQSAVEPGLFADLPGGQILYRGWSELESRLRSELPAGRAIAMEYSPRGAIPTVACVDGGTLEWLRAMGIEIVSSADLLQRVDAPLDDAAFASHREAGKRLEAIRREAVGLVRDSLAGDRTLADCDLQAFLLLRMKESGLVTSHAPIVAFGPDAGNPHYSPDPARPRLLIPEQVVLIDYWAKLDEPGAVYADYTYMSFAGRALPDEMSAVWAAVAGARDAALSFLRGAIRAGDAPRGCDADRVARAVIESAGFGEAFVHRLGHNIGEETHGSGVNLDSLETRDERRILPGIAFSIEPGIYLPGFGMRSEINAVNWAGDLFVSGEIQALPELLGGD